MGGNPLSYTDPEGLTPMDLAIGIGVQVVGGRAAAAAIGAGARQLLGPTAGGVAACLLAGVCTFNEGTKTPNSGEPDSSHVNPGRAKSVSTARTGNLSTTLIGTTTTGKAFRTGTTGGVALTASRFADLVCRLALGCKGVDLRDKDARARDGSTPRRGSHCRCC